MPGYPVEHAARRQAFERDKRLLRDEGIPVLTAALAGHEQYGYRIDRDAFYLPDLALEPDEQVALHLAVAGVHLGDPSGRDALLKLGAAGPRRGAPRRRRWSRRAALIELFEAVRTQAAAVVRLPQASAPRGAGRPVVPLRALVPGGLGPRPRGGAHVPGRPDRGRRSAGEPPAAPSCPRASTSRRRCPTSRGDAEGEDRVDMRIRVDAHRGAAGWPTRSGQDKVERPADDGSVVLVLGVSPFAALRSWVLGLLDHAEILEPPAFRAELVAWLTAHGRRRTDAGAAPTRGGAVGGRPRRRGSRRAAAARCAGKRRRASGCDGCWPWSGGWPRWARRRSPRWPGGSA